MKNWGKVLGALFGGVAICICTWMAGSAFDLNKGECAAWVQAVGSIAALAVAIWVSSSQLRRQEARDQRRDAEEVDGMLRSLRSEWEVILFALERQVGPLLEASRTGSPFQVRYPLAEEPFKIYYGLIPKLGMVRNDQLRQQIIHTYGRGQGVVMTFRHNNEMITALDEARSRAVTGAPYNVGAADAALEGLCAYGDALRRNYAETKVEVLKLLEMLPKD